MVGNQYAYSPLAQVPNDPLNVQYRYRIDTRKWLVEKNELRLGCQGPGDFDPAPFTAGQADSRRVAHVADMQFLEQFLQVRLAVSPSQVASHLEDGLNVLGDRHAAKNRGFLRQIPEAEAGTAMNRKACNIAAVQLDRAAIAADQSDDHIERSRLSGSVRAEKADDVTAFYAERESFYDLATPVALGDPARLELAHGASG